MPSGSGAPGRSVAETRRRRRWLLFLSMIAIFMVILGSVLVVSLTDRAPTVETLENPVIAENQRPGIRLITDEYLAQAHEALILQQDEKEVYRQSYADSGGMLAQTGGWTDSRNLRGYANQQSVNVGGTITFHISSKVSTYYLSIIRMGWYGGNRSATIVPQVTLTGTNHPTTAPDANGMVDLNWPVAYTLNVPTNWVSGMYAALLQRPGSGEMEYVPFVVREDSRQADIIYHIPDSTYQAYNDWGGKSLYDYNSPGGRANRVSYDRPYEQNNGWGLFLPGDYNMVGWLEREGYNVKYVASSDVDNNPNLMNTGKVFLANFHDEYWSWNMYTNLENARNSGRDVAFFTSNNIYWQVRWQNSYRTMISYKDAAADPMSTSATPWLTTVLFRDAPVNRPENKLLGTMFDTLMGYGENRPWVVTNANHWFYAGTGLSNGSTIPMLVGYEIDRVFNNGFTPSNLVTLSNSPFIDNTIGVNSVHQASIYQAASGAWVFNAATNYWPYMLLGSPPFPEDTRVQQMTRNVLNRMITDGGVAVTNTPSNTPTITPSPTATATLPSGYTLYRAINIGGPSVVIDGRTWEANTTTTPNFTAAGSATCATWITPSPTTDAPRTTMIQCYRENWAHNMVMSSVPNGNYAVYVTTWQSWNNPSPESFTISVEGIAGGTFTASNTAGVWARRGPFNATITDGTINVTTGGTALISGLEVYSTSGGPVPTNTNTPTPTNTPLAATNTPTATNTPSGPTNTPTNTFTPAPPTNTPTATNTFTPAPPTNTPTATHTPGPSSFYRAINLGGAAVTIGGNAWVANTGTTANFTTNGTAQCNPWMTLSPAATGAQATMIGCWREHWAHTMAISAVANGQYQVYVTVLQTWNDTAASPYIISLEGLDFANHNPGQVGGVWSRLGPFNVNITDGVLNLTTRGGMAVLAGIEIYTGGGVPATNTPLPATNTPTNTFTPAPATNTPTATQTFTPAPATNTPTATNTPSGPTNTPTNTFTPAPATNTPTATNTFTPAPATNTPTSTFTPAPATNTPTPTSTPTPGGAGMLYRAINIGGPVQTISGETWEANTATTTNFTTNGSVQCNQWLSLSPTVSDTARRNMITCWRNHWSFSMAMSSVPNGQYQVFLYIIQSWNDTSASNATVTIEGANAGQINPGTVGGVWSRVGPYNVNMTDGTLNITTNGGVLNIAGVEVRRAP